MAEHKDIHDELQRMQHKNSISGATPEGLEKLIRDISWVSFVGLVINLLLCIGKIVCGILGNSRSIIADGVNSLLDSVTGVAILIGVRFWSAPADSSHPYGHQRLESLITMFIGLSLVGVSFGIVYDGIMDFGEPFEKNSSTYIGMGMLALTIVAKEWLYHWTIKHSKRLNSAVLEASAFDHRSDAISTLPVLVAVGFAIWNPKLAFLDLGGAVLVSGFILHSAWKILRPSFDILTDRGGGREIHKRIIQFVMQMPGVLDVHKVRSRYMGKQLIIDLHVGVDPDMTVRHAHEIAREVERELRSAAAEEYIGIAICDALVQIDPNEE